MSVTTTTTTMAPALTLTPGVSTTQNTAPIVEHRCLYSYDLRRKQKRWQDGHLRFHTFNKRVMVYDVPRNYIGDTHWRESGFVQDGDEFELDRGVLIQVGEVLGTVNQDLSGLLEKRAKAPEIQVAGEAAPKSNVQPKAAQPAVTVSRDFGSSHILIPKSLNAVLGTPKGRMGRAAFPIKSPFESRAESENSARQDGHAPKRRRIESAAERRPPQPVYPRPALTDQQTARLNGDTLARGDHASQGGYIPHDAAKVDPRSATIDIGQSKNGSRVVRSERGDGDSVRAPLDITSPDKNDVAAAKRQSKRLPHAREQTGKSKPSKGKGEPRSEGERAATCCKRPAIIEETPINESTPSSVKHPAPSHEEPRSQSRLQLIARKPRKKLMYRDLLLQISPELNPNEQVVRSVSQQPSTGHVDPRPKRNDHTSLSSLHQLEQDRLEGRMQRQHVRLASVGHDDSVPISLDSSDEDMISRHHKTKQKSTAPAERIERLVDKGNPEEPTLDGLPPGETLQKHDVNQTLARMDELLRLRPERPGPGRQINPRSSYTAFDIGSAAKQDLETNPDHEAKPTPLAEAPCGSKTQVSSSPEPPLHNSHHPLSDQGGATQPQAVDNSRPNIAPKDIAEDITNDEPLTIPSTQDPPIINDPPPAIESPLFLTPAPNAEPTVTSPPLNEPSPPPAKPPEAKPPPAPPPSHFNVQPGLVSHLPPDPPRTVTGRNNKPALPTFKQPTRRSPRKKQPCPAKEETQIKPATIILPGRAHVPTKQARPSSGDGVGQAAEAWSVEAWELFGCGRDGVGCSLGEFTAEGG